MKQRLAATFRYVWTISLVVGIALSANFRTLPYDPLALAQVIAEHQADIADQRHSHGHSHDDIEVVVHAFQSHQLEMIEHDQNTAFLPPRRMAQKVMSPDRLTWALAHMRLIDLRGFELDRPPRA